MTFVGCDPHTRTQQVAVLDTRTGEVSEHQLGHEGTAAEEFYAALSRPVTVGIESTGYAIWFHALMQRLGHALLVGDSAKIRAMVVATSSPRARHRPASPSHAWEHGVGQDETQVRSCRSQRPRIVVRAGRGRSSPRRSRRFRRRRDSGRLAGSFDALLRQIIANLEAVPRPRPGLLPGRCRHCSSPTVGLCYPHPEGGGRTCLPRLPTDCYRPL